MPTPKAGKRHKIDSAWLKSNLDCARVVAMETGQEGKRSGEWSSFRCVLHDDHGRHFGAAATGFNCFVCGAHGSVIDFIMAYRHLDLTSAKHYLFDTYASGIPSSTRPRPIRKPTPKPPPPSLSESPQWQALAREIIGQAESALWSTEEEATLAYLRRGDCSIQDGCLRREGRGLTDERIRELRIGYQARVRFEQMNGGWIVIQSGITIPWIDQNRVWMVNVRTDDPTRDRYETMTGSNRGGVYPNPATIETGRPLVIVEGELDAALLGQELAGVASVITLGGATSTRLPGVVANHWPIYLAFDCDPSGSTASQTIQQALPLATKVKPPLDIKDWGDTYQAGIELRQFWIDVFAGLPTEARDQWAKLSRLRGRGCLEPERPGLVVDGLDPERLRAACDALATADDEYSIAEREAIRLEDSLI